MITVSRERMTKFLEFNPETGSIINRRTRREAGTFIKARGYRAIGIDYVVFKAHRLMWFYVHGIWPEQIDHINGRKDDNRIENLREANNRNNCNRFMQSNNTSGFKGVTFHVRIKRWQARIGIGKRRIHLGYFDTAEEAYSAYCVAAPLYHGEYARIA